MMALLLLLAMQAPASGGSDALTHANIRAMSPAALGRRLLGERGRNVDRVEFPRSHLQPPGITDVRLFDRPIVLDDAFCVQTIHLASLEERPGQMELRFRNDAIDAQSLALAPGCRMREGQVFAYLNPNVARADAMALLTSFAAIHSAARGSRPLPFRLICRDDFGADPDVCRAGARRALAAIRPERTWLITRGDNDADLRLVIGDRGQLYWEVRVERHGDVPAVVTIIWKEPAPF